MLAETAFIRWRRFKRSKQDGNHETLSRLRPFFNSLLVVSLQSGYSLNALLPDEFVQGVAFYF